MRTEVVISSAYEAAWCQLKGLTCRIVPTSKGDDVEFVFADSKAIREVRRQFEEDCGIQELVEAVRRVKWSAKRTLHEADRSRQ